MSTDKYPALGPMPPIRYRMRRTSAAMSPLPPAIVTYGRTSGPPLVRVWRRLDVPPPIVLDAAETSRERVNRLALACARFIADERERARARASRDAG